MVQNNQKSRRRYWAIRSSIRTAHSFACSALFALLASSAAPYLSLFCSFAPELVGKRFLSMIRIPGFHTVLNHSVQEGYFNAKYGFS